jgi:hypothetical protein
MMLAEGDSGAFYIKALPFFYPNPRNQVATFIGINDYMRVDIRPAQHQNPGGVQKGHGGLFIMD